MATILVTGGARRIGRVVALRLAAEGWHVVVHYHRSAAAAKALADEINQGGGQASVATADLGDQRQAEALIPALVRSGRRPDALVNNASRFVYDTPADFTPGGLQDHIAVNTLAPLLLTRALADSLPGDARAAVVNVLDAKLSGLNPDYFTYTLSKYALEGATRMQALAYAPRVRINAVAPGVTLPSDDLDPASFTRAHRRNPLGRGASPEDIAAAVTLLLDTPSITGHTILLDGGAHLAPSARDVAFLADQTDA